MYKFKVLIEWKLLAKPNLPLVFQSEPFDSFLLSNAWLSGFIDADGSFDIRVNPTRVRFRLEQRKIANSKSYEPIMNQICKELN
jgi:hypothetical protein